jgi:hypothetical protein
VASRVTGTLHLAYGKSRDAHFFDSDLDLVKLERLDDCGD